MDQPAPPSAPALPHAFNLAGETSDAKRKRLAQGLKKAGVEAAIITLADSVCWLLNIRGHDVPHTPFTLAFAILHDDGSATLFLDEKKRNPELITHLGGAVQLHAPSQFAAALECHFRRAAPGRRQDQTDARSLPAAQGLQEQRRNRRHAQGPYPRRRCAVPVPGWFAGAAPGGELTEIAAAEQLEGFRRATGCLSDLSFDSISGAGSNGAIVHYRVTRSTNRRIGLDEMFLIDSGAQYPDGTTDVTRTVMVGTATPEMKDRFTRVLKGHIALATARFPAGTIGMQLDGFARRPLWDAGLDYDHGTGHGVGSYLSVHEGPQNISKKPVNQALLPGMVCSNEPGFYKTGEYGIRIENLVVVTDAREVPGGERPMMALRNHHPGAHRPGTGRTCAVTETERGWLNAYHARVLEMLRGLVDDETRAWLERATRAI